MKAVGPKVAGRAEGGRVAAAVGSARLADLRRPVRGLGVWWARQSESASTVAVAVAVGSGVGEGVGLGVNVAASASDGAGLVGVTATGAFPLEAQSVIVDPGGSEPDGDTAATTPAG